MFVGVGSGGGGIRCMVFNHSCGVCCEGPVEDDFYLKLAD